MRLLVNAVGLRAGGGLTVGLNCLRGIRELRADYELMALVPAGCGYEALCAELSIPYRAFPRTVFYPAWRLWFDQVQVGALARRWAADVLFTMNNQAAWAVRCPQVLLFHNPYYIYPSSEWWPLVSPFERGSLLLQRCLFAATAPRCAGVAVQTRVAALRLRERFRVPGDRVSIVHSAIAAEHSGPETEEGRRLAARMTDAASGRIKVLTLARYYPHKDLEFIVRVARRLKALEDRRFIFFLTIAADQHPGARGLLASIDQERLADEVINLGPLDYRQLRGVYSAADVCFLPTVLESLSGTHLEALHYRLPIVTTERDFTRDTCGRAAYYFPIGDVHRAIGQLAAAASWPPALRQTADPPAPRTWTDVCRDLTGLLDGAHRSRGSMDRTVRAGVRGDLPLP
jgi:glycosyltransferase involved in cell wall biosynthesis